MNNIVNLFYSYVMDFIKLWLVLWGVINLPRIHEKKGYFIAAIPQFILIVAAACFYKADSDEITFLYTFIVIFAVVFLFQESFFKKLAFSLLSYMLILFLDTSIVGLISLYANKSNYGITNNSLLRLLCNLISILVIGVVIYFRQKKRIITLLHISKRVYALLFAGASTGFLILTALLVSTNNKASENARKVMIVITIIIIAAYYITCLMIIITTESRDNYKTLSLINENIIKSQQQYYSLVNEKQQEIRSIRHEIKNHLACIHALNQANKYKEMEDYIGELVKASDISDELFEAGNDIVNAILNDAQSKYRKDNILIRLEGCFPKDLTVSPMDLCVIFANAVSNAVEAILRMERQQEQISYIDIKIRSFKDDLFIDFRNPVQKSVILKNGKMVTSKSDKSKHGFGVKNIIKRVESYHGTVNFRNENGEFAVEINMKNRA